MTFELLVAARYLRARRKQAVISLITFISVAGVAAGVAALVIAMAVSEGQRQDIQARLLGAQAHITILPAGRQGILNYIDLTKQIEQVEGVASAAPHAEQMMVISTPAFDGVLVKGIIPEMESRVSLLSQSVISGKLSDLTGNTIAIGKQLAENLGFRIGDRVWVVSATSTGAPLGKEQNRISFKIAAIYSIGLYEYDRGLAYVPIGKAQYLMGVNDSATNIEVKVRDIDRSTETGEAIIKRIGPGYVFEDWKVTHRTIFQALKLERLGMAIAIGLIVFVAALNIIATLTMMVHEKTRDIATLMAMGANLQQIRRIFVLQGVIIGFVGTTIGLAAGHAISYLADRYHWIALAPDVYSIAYLPLRADLWDSTVIAGSAILISFLATLYPSAAAAKLQPVEALRYE